jgi:ribosomal protein S18 acetylase RimI-like enzyme
MAIACLNWREAAKGSLAALYAGEIRRWSTALGWETASSWEHIELGRRLGTVPGLLALDPTGNIAGWTFYVLHRGVLQIGGFVAVSEPVTTALLESIFTSEAAGRARSATAFVFSDAPGLEDALSRRGLAVGAYHYLIKTLPSRQAGNAADGSLQGSLPSALRRWHPRDRTAVATLLGTAYPGADGVRPFAPGGTVDEWSEYVGQLVGAEGCGTIMTGSCFVAPDGSDRVSGVVLVTRLASATAHIAQLAVDPAGRRRGLGRLLVNAACASASDAGCDRMTLLVEGGNVAARRLYEVSGFCTAAHFVSAGSDQPLRSMSVAAGGAAAVRA